MRISGYDKTMEPYVTWVIFIASIDRLHTDKGGGAWCPKNMVTKEGKEFLEVNLHNPRILTSTQTQGRFGNGHGVEYTEEYFIDYWRPGFNKWVRWRNRRGMHVSSPYHNTFRLNILVLFFVCLVPISYFLCIFNIEYIWHSPVRWRSCFGRIRIYDIHRILNECKWKLLRR